MASRVGARAPRPPPSSTPRQGPNGEGPTTDEGLARRLLEAAPDGMLAVDREGTIEMVNQQVERLFGYPRAELLGRKIEMLLPTRYAEAHVSNRSNFFADPVTRPMGFGLSLAGRRKDGTEFPVDISLSPVESEKGKLVVAAIRDITGRRQAEDEVHKISERFRHVMESSPDGIVIVGPTGVIQQVNAEAERQFGFSREEMIGSTVEMLLPERLRGVHLAHRNNYPDQGITRQLGTRHGLCGRKKDGTEFPADISLSPLATSDGSGGVARIRDMTEPLRLQHEMSEKAALIDLAHDAIVVLDPVGDRIRYWNRGAEDLYGYTAEEAVGQIGGDLLKRVGPATFAEMVTRAAQSDHWDCRVKHTTRTGEQLVVESRWAVLRDAAHKVSGILEVNRDITDRLRAEDALREANQSLEVRVQERTEELESFSSSVAHDLRTPLRAISGFVDILVEEAPGGLNSEALDALAEVRANAVRMGELIDDLLAFARLGKQDLEKREVDMSKLARRAVDRLAPIMDGRSIELNIQPMPRCQGDPAVLEQVWTNLLANAIKFTAGRDPARVTAGSEEQDGRVTYFVRDNGVGFDMAHAGKLFGVFQRLHAADEFEGTGIGLATVMRITKRHGGTAWTLASPGRGATFYFTVGGNQL